VSDLPSIPLPGSPGGSLTPLALLLLRLAEREREQRQPPDRPDDAPGQRDRETTTE
jgi:hypothetical protein